jgi:hypothetical protein
MKFKTDWVNVAVWFVFVPIMSGAWIAALWWAVS